MRKAVQVAIVTATLVVASSCSKDATEPGAGDCAATTSVNATVSAGANPVFSWSPACGVVIVLIEEDADDRWGIISANGLSDAATANTIKAPVTYGTTPQGTVQIQPPEALLAGHTYELILWRLLPAGNAGAGCKEKIDNLCLLVVHEFTR